MSKQLIAHSPDLKRLQDEGYSIAVRGNHLVVSRVPYLNSQGVVCYGALVCPLNLSDNVTTARPGDHVIHFCGEHPCDKTGERIKSLINASNRNEIIPDLFIDHSFSNKPPEGYPDFYAKVSTYAAIISAYAKSVDPSVTEKPFDVIVDEDEDADESVFRYRDTNSSRANIDVLNGKFKGQKIAIVGVGGTGSYILDLLSKTAVSEIHPFDGDELLQHNAFRSPGALSQADLSLKRKKADHYAAVYSVLHKGIVSHPYLITQDNLDELLPFTFVFLCVDKNRARNLITNFLVRNQIPFIDVGLGVEVIDNKLTGMLRVTASTSTKTDHLSRRLPLNVEGDNDYGTNIQIAELNAMNASLAVIRWKKWLEFYHDLEHEHNTIYTTTTGQINNDETAA